jgi:Mrp family chromosome partitioning ATPase
LHFSMHKPLITQPSFLVRLVRGALLGLTASLLLIAAASAGSAQTASAATTAEEAPVVTKYQAITRQPGSASSTQILQGIGLLLTICLGLLFVRTVRNEALAARQAELEGWAAPGQLATEAELVGSSTAEFDEPERLELDRAGEASEPEANHDSASEPLDEPQPEAAVGSSSGRVIYHVGPYHFAADREVLGPATQNHLADLCDALCSPDNERRVLRIASGLSCRYAKSQLAAQLAQMLADREDMRVLALEGDLDAPALHRVMQVNVPRGYGLSEQLQRMAELDTIDTASAMQLSPNLHVLVESRWSTPAALGLPQFSQLLSRQRDVYDFVIIDGPVVDTWPDAEHFERLIDGVVFVTLASTRLPDTLSLVGNHFSNDLLLRIIKTGEPSGT